VAVKQLVGTLLHTTLRFVVLPRDRWRLAGVVLVGAAIPMVELMVAKVFTDLITTGGSGADLRSIAPQLLLFAALVLATQAVHYAQRTYRVTVVARVLDAQAANGSAQRESWQWAQALELITALTALTQMVVTATLFLVLAPVFGAINALLVWALLEAVGRLFAGQVDAQRQYVARGRARAPVATHLRVRSRVVSAERGTTIAALGSAALMVCLLLLGIRGTLDVATTIVLFLGLRMQKTTFATLSGSAMRFARAQAQVG
jgi:hypothetical protein